MAERIDITLDDIAAALQYLDCCDVDVWLRAGMAMKREFGDVAFDIWDAWSQGFDRYKATETRMRWKNWKGSSARGTVSIGTVLHWAFDRGFKIEKPELTKEQKDAFIIEQQARRKVLAEQWAKEQADQLKWYDAIADVSERMMPLLKTVGNSPYLGKKKINSCGCYFPSEPFLLDFKDNFTVDIVTGRDAIQAVFNRKKANKAAGNDADSILHINRGTIVIPLFDENFRLRNMQVIFKGNQKENSFTKLFLYDGQKSKLFHVIGSLADDVDSPVAFVEGFATGASVHMATGWPVVVTFDSGNLPVVCGLPRFKDMLRSKIIAGDNDWETALDPKKKNTGIVKAKEAAAVCGGAWCVPEFAGDAAGLSDFNDLHVAAHLDFVRLQLQAAIDGISDQEAHQLGKIYLESNRVPNEADEAYLNSPVDCGDIPASAYEDYFPLDDSESLPADSPAPTFEKAATIELLIARYKLIIPNGKIWDSFKKVEIPRKTFELSLGSKAIFNEWIAHPDCGQVDLSEVREEKSAAEKEGGGELGAVLARYIYLDPSSEAWDSERGELVALNDLRYSIASVFDQWLKHPKRLSMPKANLVFDPTQKVNAETHINLFRGLPVGPSSDSSKCLNIIRLIRHLCNCPMDANELVKSTQRYRDSYEAYQWLMRWIALPLQKVGTKMHTAVLMHGEVHGSGKSLLWGGVIKAIYGRYAGVFGQQQIESQYNEWQSGKLFGVFEEVLTRSSRYNHLGALKHLITSDRIRIEEKYRSGREENNHLNCAFLSNDIVPIPIEQYDRRMFVLVPEATLPIELQRSVAHEIENGGIEAFYGVLLQYDLAGFTKSTKPLMNQAKINLIENARAGWEVFFDEWKGGYLDVPFCSCLIRDLYRYYVGWCNERHETRVSMNRFSGFIASKRVERAQDAHYVVNASYTNGTKKGNFFIVGSAPEGMAVQVWLGGCVAEFARIIAQSNFVSEAA